MGDGGRRCPLYRGGCRRPPWRLGPTVVAHSGKGDLTVVGHDSLDVRPPWLMVVSSFRRGLMYIFDRFQNGSINLQIRIKKYIYI
jgi:hypothetical protein